jgi:hypothetical protein
VCEIEIHTDDDVDQLADAMDPCLPDEVIRGLATDNEDIAVRDENVIVRCERVRAIIPRLAIGETLWAQISNRDRRANGEGSAACEHLKGIRMSMVESVEQDDEHPEMSSFDRRNSRGHPI